MMPKRGGYRARERELPSAYAWGLRPRGRLPPFAFLSWLATYRLRYLAHLRDLEVRNSTRPWTSAVCFYSRASVPSMAVNSKEAAAALIKLEQDLDGEAEVAQLAAEQSKKPTPKKRRERKGFLICIGCDELKPIEEFDLSQKVDKQCKKYLDRIAGQCRTQGKCQWFSQQRATNKGTKQMLDFYRKILAACVEDGGKPKFVVAQYSEEHTTEQAVEYRGRGAMMWEGQAVDFWITPAGGGLSRDEAQAKWDTWSVNYKAMEIIHDFLSPNAAKPLRLRVPTSDEVVFINRQANSKKVVKSEQAIKKPKEADLDKLHARACVGFDKHGNGSASSDMRSTAQSMVSAGAGQAFSDVAVLLPDITVLGGNTGEDEEKTMDEATSAAGPAGSEQQGVAGSLAKGSSPEEPSSAGKGQKRKWCDLDKEINTARRNMRGSCDSLKRTLEEVLQSLTKELKNIDTLPSQAQRLCVGEKAMAKNRVTTIQLILGNDAQELATFMASFSKPQGPAPAPAAPADGAAAAAAGAGGGSGADGASTVAGATRAMTKAPPCGNYMALVTLDSFDELFDELEQCTDVDAIKAVQNKFTVKKQPFSSLLGASRTAIGEL